MNGDIGKYELDTFWNSYLNEGERGIIRELMGRVDEKEYSEAECGGLYLFSLASRCTDFAHARETGRRIARYAMKNVRRWPDHTFTCLHGTYTSVIRLWWADRHNIDKAVTELLSYCNLHDMAEPHIRTGLRKENPDMVMLPRFAGIEYQMLYYEEVGDVNAAQAWAKKGKHRGWTGEWDEMIERCA